MTFDEATPHIPSEDSMFFEEDAERDSLVDPGNPGNDKLSVFPFLLEDTEKPVDNQAEEILKTPPQELAIKWSEKPSVTDQFILRPESCKPGPIVTKVFDLCDLNDLNSFNQIKERAFPEGMPKIVILREEIVPFDASSTFKAILQYRPISYMVLQNF